MASTTEKREFTLDKHAIALLIQSQAGSLEKAILEGVANALDAGAKSVNIELTAERVVITDDGRGFSTKKELEDFFERFAFDHSGLDRKVGRFGVGRGQMFHFGRNLWTTHGYTMAVDVRENTFGYELGTTKKKHKGVKIEIDLYDPMSFSKMNQVEQELLKLVRYCTIPVLINGRNVVRDPKEMKWDAETDDAWFKLDDGYSIKVYSQGLFVQDLSASRFGKGGIVVTKLGKPLKQNMARNDILANDCEVFKRVSSKIKDLAKTHKDKARKGKVITNDMRASLAQEAIAGDGLAELETFMNTPLFTLTNGRHVRLSALLGYGFVACAPPKDPAADLLIQRKQAALIVPRTLESFGVDNMKDFTAKIQAAVDRYGKIFEGRRDYHSEGWAERYKVEHALRQVAMNLESCQFFETVADLPMQANVDLTEIKPKEMKDDEKLLMTQVRRDLLPVLSRIVHDHLHADEDDNKDVDYWVSRYAIPQRKLRLAVGEGFKACTDGHSIIWLDRTFVKNCIRDGATGFQALAMTIVHELIHDVDSSTGHGHDQAFYQAFHDITVDGACARHGLSAYARWLRAGGRAAHRSIVAAEGVGLMDTQGAHERQQALLDLTNGADTVDAGQADEAQAKPRKRKPKP